jgi:hypothetical protein
MPKMKYLKVEHSNKVKDCPNISKTGSVKGMKKHFWGEDALTVQCGSYIYNVTSKPNIYHYLAY